MSSPVRILQILSSVGKNSGIASVVLNWHRRLDRSRFQFDYLLFLRYPENESFESEIKQLGGRIHYLPLKGRVPGISFFRDSYRFFKEHNYPVVHSHVVHLSLFFYPLAKYLGKPKIIQHAHSTRWSDKKLNAVRNYLCLHSVWPLIDCRLACSDMTGKDFYKKNYTVFNNGIDLAAFRFNPQIREQKRAELQLQGKLVVGHIGRFEIPKNHFFLIDIFEQIHRRQPNAVLLLLGKGSRFEAVQKYVRGKNLQKEVFFLGVRNDVSDWLQAMDIFLLPSLFEGLPVVGVEAQAAGLPCVFADTITPEVLLGNARQVSLAQTAAHWADIALEMASQGRKTTDALTNFDIGKTTEKLSHIYEKFCG